MQVLPRWFKLSPWIDHDRFYAKVKFGDIGLCKGKSDFFLETVAAFSLKVASSIQLNKLMKLSEYQKSMSFFDLDQRSLRLKLKLVFSQKQLGNLEPKRI